MEQPTHNTSPLRAVFVDYGNVCETYSFQLFLRAFEETTGVRPEESEKALFSTNEEDGEYSQLFRDLETGVLSPNDFFHHFTRTLDCADKIDYETFAQHWCNIFIEENNELSALLDEVRLPLYLLSNMNEIVHKGHMTGNALVRKHFPYDGQHILSYREGVMKPNRKIYDIALARAGVSPEEAFFIDDNPENILGWRVCGGRGVVYNAKTDSIDLLRQQFQALDIIA